MTTLTSPPTWRSTDASLVSQSCSACHQRRMTSSLVHASKTAWAGASNVRSMRSVVFSVMLPAPARGGGEGPPSRGRAGARYRRRSRQGGAPPPAPRRRVRSRAVLVLIVLAPPLVRRGLRVALRRVLPLLLASQRGDVEVGPGAAHVLVAPVVDEVGPEDLLAVPYEGVGAVPLAHPEVRVELVRDGVPRHRPAHAPLEPPNVLLRCARGVRERGVAGVQVGEVGHLVGSERAARAAALRPARHVRVVEEPVDDQLAAPLEEVEQSDRPIGPVERVVPIHRHPWHPAPLGGKRVTDACDLLLPHEHLLASGHPFLRRDDRRHVFHCHLDSSSFRYSSTTSNIRPHRARWRSIQSAASLSTSGWSDSRWVRPSITRVTTPVSSSTFRCFVIAGFETPKPCVASPTVAGPAASRSTIPRRIGCDSALNESLTTGLTVATAAATTGAGRCRVVVPPLLVAMGPRGEAPRGCAESMRCGRVGRWPSAARHAARSRWPRRRLWPSPRRPSLRPPTRRCERSRRCSALIRSMSPTPRAGCSRSRSGAACGSGSSGRTSGASRSRWCPGRAPSAPAASAGSPTRSTRRCPGAVGRSSPRPARRSTSSPRTAWSSPRRRRSGTRSNRIAATAWPLSCSPAWTGSPRSTRAGTPTSTPRFPACRPPIRARRRTTSATTSEIASG